MKYKSLVHKWKGLIWGIALYVIFSVAPAIIVLRYFFTINYVSLIGVLFVSFIGFVIGRKTYWAYGDRAMAITAELFSFFGSNGRKNNNIRKFKHDKNQGILEIRLDKGDINILFALMFFFSLYIAVAVYFLFFGEIELRFPGIDRGKLLGCICLIIILHEALHAFAALLWGKVPWRSIHFGFKWEWGAFYCHCDRPLKVDICQIIVLFPFIVTTPIAGLILWSDPSIWSLLLFSFTIAACAGDVLIFLKVSQVENDQWVHDHPSAIGCIIGPEAISVSSEEHCR